MSRKKSTTPDELKDANRVLYINVAGDYNGKQRKGVRQVLHRRIIGITGKKWKSIRSNSSYLFHKENNDESYAELVHQVNAAIQSMPDTLTSKAAKFTVHRTDVQFEIFVPMPRNAEAEACDVKTEQFIAGLETLSINTPKKGMSDMQSTHPKDLRGVARLLYINLTGNYSGPQRTEVRRILSDNIREKLWESRNKTTSYLFHKRINSQSYAQLASQVISVIDGMPSSFKCKKVEFTVPKKHFRFDIYVLMPRDAETEGSSAKAVKKEEPDFEDDKTEEPSTSGSTTDDLAARMGEMNLKTPKEEENNDETPK